MTETFSEGIARLRREGEESTPASRPERLPVGAVRFAPAVFQVRWGSAPEGDTDATHVQALRRALEAKREGERVLDPVTLFVVGRHAYCIDGHHRLGAYRAAKVAGPVPVEWFDGTLEEAVAEAARRNQKLKLPMRPSERQEAAWRLVVLGAHSKRKTAEASGVSQRTVANMRAILRRVKERDTGEPIGAYWETLRWLKGEDSSEYTDEQRQAEIAWFVDGLVKQFGKRAAERPELFGEAVYQYGGERLVQAIAGWLAHSDDDEAGPFDF